MKQKTYSIFCTDFLSIGAVLVQEHYVVDSIFSFSRSVNDAKRGVEFRHATRIAAKVWRKVRNGIELKMKYLNTSQIPSADSAHEQDVV